MQNRNIKIFKGLGGGVLVEEFLMNIIFLRKLFLWKIYSLLGENLKKGKLKN